MAILFGVQGMADAAVAPSQLDVLSWRSIGPQLGGRSLAVAGSQSRPNEYWFGATGGGAWKTTDGGTTWRPMTDGALTSSSVGAVAVCPKDPDVVYIGTGESDLRGSIMTGDGVYKTTDGGATWNHIGLADSQAISKIRIDPTNCDRAFVAALGHPFGANTQRGVFRTTDGGATWQRVLYKDDLTGAADVAIDPSNPNVVYASLWHVFRKPWLLSSGGGAADGLYKSTDGGDTWMPLSSNPGMPAAPLGKIGIAVSPADPNRVYALVEAKHGGLYRSDDAGATWQLVDGSHELTQRAFYYMHPVADPRDPATVYVLNVGLLKSTDGGKTFSSLRPPHGDNHDMWIAPDDPSRMVEGNDGGATVTVNGGDSWTDEDQSSAQIYHVTTTNDTPYLVCGAQQDRDTVCVPSNGDGTEHFSVGGGESGYVAVDPRDSNVFYAGSYGGYLTRFDRRTGQARNVNPWPDNPMGHPARDLKERFQWTFPIMTSPADPRAVYAGSQHVFRSTNGGQSWQQISPDLTRADPATLGDSGGPITKDQSSPEYYADVFAIGPSPLDRRVIWAGSDDGLIHVTRNLGRSWSDVTPPGLPRFIRMSIIDPGHQDPGTAYVAAHRYRLDDQRPFLLKTHDFGRTWTRITTGIPRNDFAWSIREDPQRRGLLYAGTNHGVWVSFDDGAHWQSLRLNLPDSSVQDLTVKGDDLVIATHGRGFYVLSGLSLLRQLTPGATAAAARLFGPATAVRRQDRRATVYYSLPRGATRGSLALRGARGRVLRRSRVSGRAGIHRHAWRLPERNGRYVVSLHIGRRVLRRTLTVSAARTPRWRRPPRLEGDESLADAQQTESGATKDEVAGEAARAHPRARGESVSSGGVTLFDPKDPVRSVDRGATVTYSLSSPAHDVSMTFLDRRGRAIQRLTGLPTAAGTHSATWNLRYPGPVSYPGLVFWAASPTRGPEAPLGTYQVRLNADGQTLAQRFRILKDPRLTDITKADIAAEFRLARRIVRRESDANQRVLNIRACTSQVDARVGAAGDPDVTRAGQSLDGKLTAVSDAIHQSRIVSSEDALNFPIRLDNKIAALLGVVESADARPTDQDQEVFHLLSGQLAVQEGHLGTIVAHDVPSFNALLQSKGLAPIACRR